MFHQTLDLTDWPRLITLAFIELALSADNAIVLGLFIHSLPSQLRKKALLIGILSAFFFRGAALLSISVLMRYFWIQLLGGGYLIYLSLHHFCSRKKKSLSPPHLSFWKTILLIELFDLVFAIDSILAGLTLITSTRVPESITPKLWIVYFGGMIGVLGIRYAAEWFGALIYRFPRLETSAFLLIGWIGLKLCYVGIEPFLSKTISYEPLFWGGMALALLWGISYKKTLDN